MTFTWAVCLQPSGGFEFHSKSVLNFVSFPFYAVITYLTTISLLSEIKILSSHGEANCSNAISCLLLADTRSVSTCAYEAGRESFAIPVQSFGAGRLSDAVLQHWYDSSLLYSSECSHSPTTSVSSVLEVLTVHMVL